MTWPNDLICPWCNEPIGDEDYENDGGYVSHAGCGIDSESIVKAGT